MRDRARERRLGAVALVTVTVLLASCQWTTFGFGPGRAGSNSPEQTIGVGNVAQLQLRFSTVTTGQTAVVGGHVYQVGRPASSSGDLAILRVFDAAGVDGCSGSPTTCAPQWTAAVPGVSLSGPTVVGGAVYVS